MSFILESLKQAQRERKSGSKLDLGPAHTDPDGPRGRPRLWIWISILLAIAVVALAAALWFGASSRIADAPGAREGNSNPISAAPDDGRPGKSAAKPTSLPADKRGKTRQKAARPLALEAEVSGSAGKTSKSETKTKGPPQPETVTPGESPGVADETGHDESMADVNDETDSALMEREAPPGDGGAIPLFEELSRETREQLGHLEINLHAWSRDPAKSLVVVNMRRYRAGDRIDGDGPLVEAITPDGVIIDHGNGRARLLAK